MVNYNNSKIYKIVNNVNNKIYIGSTCNLLRVRWNWHKADMKKKPNRLIYQEKYILGVQNFRIILIENFACNNRNELRAREQFYIELLKPSLNYGNALRTEEKKKDYIK